MDTDKIPETSVSPKSNRFVLVKCQANSRKATRYIFTVQSFWYSSFFNKLFPQIHITVRKAASFRSWLKTSFNTHRASEFLRRALLQKAVVASGTRTYTHTYIYKTYTHTSLPVLTPPQLLTAAVCVCVRVCVEVG